jgi:hypothetical protein
MTSRRLLSILSIVLSMLACSLPGRAIPAAAEPTSSPSGAPSSSSAGGACDNPLYPVAVGVTWSYSTTSTVLGDFTRSILAVTANGFTDQDVFSGGITRTGEWNCDHGALITLQPDAGPSGVVQANNITAEFHTTDMSGVTLPATVDAGTSWTQNFTIEGVESIGGQDIPAKNETAYSCTGGGTESVTVPAGTFDAVRMNCTTDMTITVTMNGVDVPTAITNTSTLWYAPGIGLVKSDNVISTGENRTIELTAYTIP